MRRLITWQRTSMKQERITHLAIIAAHREILAEVTDEEIAAEFVSKQEARIRQFGRF